MANPARAKGTRWERTIVDYLCSRGFRCERAPLWGSADKGDILGVPGWTLSAKAVKTIDLARFVDDARKQAGNAGAAFAAVIVKRRQRPVGDAYVVMTLDQFAELLLDGNESESAA